MCVKIIVEVNFCICFIQICVYVIVMGVIIFSCVDGILVSEYGKGKLEFMFQNEVLLNDIVRQVESFVSLYF